MGKFLFGVIISSSKLFFYADTQHQFNARESDWGFTSFMPRSALYDLNKGDWGFTSFMPRSAHFDPNNGYLVNDTIVVEAEDAVCRVVDYCGIIDDYIIVNFFLDSMGELCRLFLSLMLHK
ncbi:hypothetical protein AMTRI_Chr04g249690 [Amborella trichopoda]